MILKTLNLNISNLYNIANAKTKSMANTYIEELKEKGLLTGYFGSLAKNIYRRTRVKNSEILELFIYGSYVEEQNKLNKYEQKIMYEDINYYYQQGQEEVVNTQKKKKSVSDMDMTLFLYLLEQPNYTGVNLDQCIQATIQYNTQQLYRQVLINIQQQKELEIENNEFQRILNQQQNTKLCINNNKISGFMDNQVIGLTNLAKVEGIKKQDNNAKVVFLGNVDGNETPMCHSLHRQAFYIDKENVFDRYYGETAKNLSIRRIKCFGLVLGLNLPPISHHFHWCRSIVQYLPIKMEGQVDNLESDILDNMKEKVTNIIYDKEILKFDELPIKYKNNFLKILNNSEENTKIILSREYKNANYIVTNKEKSLYDNILNIVKINTKKSESTLAHELFHKIDRKYKISKSNKIYNCLKSDLQKIEMNKINIINQLKKIDPTAFTVNNIGKIVLKEEYRGLADIINGYSKGNIKLGYGHTKKYWKKSNSLGKETFAQFGRMYYENNSRVINTLDRLLPNTKEYIDNSLKEVARNV